MTVRETSVVLKWTPGKMKRDGTGSFSCYREMFYLRTKNIEEIAKYEWYCCINYRRWCVWWRCGIWLDWVDSLCEMEKCGNMKIVRKWKELSSAIAERELTGNEWKLEERCMKELCWLTEDECKRIGLWESKWMSPELRRTVSDVTKRILSLIRDRIITG